ARVLAVARGSEALEALAQDIPGVATLALDARDEGAPAKVFDRGLPDILVIGGGVFPPTGALHELSWDAFSINWESDAKIAFNFLKAALTRPLAPGATIVLLSSGAGLAGSPNSGGYAPAKRAQIFMANYAQKESDRLGLGLKILSLAPRIMPDTELGKYAIAGYAGYLGVSEADFVKSMSSPPSGADAAQAVIDLVTGKAPEGSHVYIVSGVGLQAAPA
ncbi:MAG TPA: SDR family oxidoreductase, partial [Phenylobacterium sp.]|nr:SDR family oxidoreductase [Phenylobacterium sp.]